MNRVTNINYIVETESYIEKVKDTMPKNVYDFIKTVCQDERKYISLVESYSQTKGVLKVPEVKV